MLFSSRLPSINLVFALLLLLTRVGFADPAPETLSVWANEAIVATYSLDAEHLVQDQQASAKYFTSTAWLNFLKAFDASGISAAIKKNSYQVSAVATLPPTIKTMSSNTWQATMSLLVWYKNPAYQQKQTLNVTIQFTQVPNSQGVRGLAITNFKAEVAAQPCPCNATPKL